MTCNSDICTDRILLIFDYCLVIIWILFQPRDQFISKLMKKLKISTTKMASDPEENHGDVVESWEDLDDSDNVVSHSYFIQKL